GECGRAGQHRQAPRGAAGGSGIEAHRPGSGNGESARRVQPDGVSAAPYPSSSRSTEPAMSPRRLAKLVSVSAFAVGLFGLALAGGLAAAGKQEEAKKYHDQLKASKDPKKKVEALEELGKLGQVMKSLAEPAVPDVIKATEDKS